MRALVLAAGVGSRLGAVTRDVPKPMVRIAGRPILESNVRLLARYGFDELALNTHYLPRTIVDHFGDGAAFGVRIRYHQEPELLGTAGALRSFADFWNDTFAVVYGDNLSTVDFAAMLELHRRTHAALTLAVFERPDVTASGIVGFDARTLRIERFLEKPKPAEVFSHYVSAGIMLCEPRVTGYAAAQTPSDFGRDVLPAMLAAGETLSAHVMGPGERLFWIDSLPDLERTRALLEGEGGAETL